MKYYLCGLVGGGKVIDLFATELAKIEGIISVISLNLDGLRSLGIKLRLKRIVNQNKPKTSGPPTGTVSSTGLVVERHTAPPKRAEQKSQEKPCFPDKFRFN